MKEKISVIIPVFNAQRTINRCIDSILNQTYQNIEVIIIDDGSEDETIKKCELYNMNLKVKIISILNNGVSNARNIGIKNASGTYLVFVDADDYVEKNMIEELYKNLEDNDLVICGKNIITNKGKIVTSFKLEKSSYTKKDFITLYEAKVINPPYCKLYIASIIEKNGIKFREGLTIAEDLLFNIDYISEIKNNIKIVNFNLYNYEKLENTTLSEKYIKDMFQMKLKIYKRLIKFYYDDNILSKDDEKKIEQLAFELILDSVTNEFRNKTVSFWKRYKNAQYILKIKDFEEILVEVRKKNIINKFELIILKSHAYILYFILRKGKKR